MIGVDLVAVAPFREQLDLPGSRFAEVFTPSERRTSAGKPGTDPARHLAARFAAKKASTGCSSSEAGATRASSG